MSTHPVPRLALLALLASAMVAARSQTAPAASPSPAWKNIPLGEGADAPTLSFGGKLRVRTEHWENFSFGPDNDDEFQLYRAFLNAELRLSPALRVFAEGKSAHGDGRDLPGGNRTIDTDSLDLHQGYLELTLGLGGKESLSLRPGRQELLFGKQRLVSPLDWVNTRRTFDAVRASFVEDSLRVDAFASRLVAVDRYGFDDEDSGENFHGVYATGKAGDSLSFDLYAFYLDKDSAKFASSTNQEERVTLGLRLWGQPKDTAWDYDVEGAYQVGDFGSQDIRAWMIAVECGHTFRSAPGGPRVYVGYDYASGDGNGTDGEVETFNQLYPLGHAFFGFIDLVGRQNIQDASLGASLKPMPKVTLKLDGHWFTLAHDADALYNAGGAVARAGGKGEDEVGSELDVTARIDLNPRTSMLLGASRFFAGDFIQATGSAEDVDFLYASLEFGF